MKNIMAGNWKMNQSLKDIDQFFTDLQSKKDLIGKTSAAWIAPQFIHFSYVRQKAKELGINIEVGVQNCSNQEKGAFTGEVSPVALKDIGCTFVIIGHSERRTIYHESNDLLNQKLHAVLKQNLKVVFCLGETLEEREKGDAEKVVREQLIKGLKGLTNAHLPLFIIAYEPVWAIGTGKTASPQQAQEMHAFIRKVLSNELQLDGEMVPLLYGGSVNPQNVAELMSQKDINGGLVGGASLKGPDYIQLCAQS